MRRSLLLVWALLLIAGCRKSPNSRWLREFELYVQNFDSEAMQMVKTDSQLILPDSARGLNFRYSPPIDPAFIARLAIPEETVDQVRKQIEAIKNEQINISGGLSTRTAWWTPRNGTVIVARQCHQADNDYFRVILTKEEDGFILYIDHAVF